MTLISPAGALYPSGHYDWLSKRHVTQARPGTVSPETSAGIIRKESFSLWGVAKLQSRSLEFLVVTIATTYEWSQF